MDPTIPTPTVCSTVTTSSVSMQAPPPTPLHLLEITLISAQDLAPVSKSMHTYAVAWLNPARKLSTRTDPSGHTRPTWNHKLPFRIDPRDDTAAVTVEIYAASWFREVLVGTVCVLIADLLGAPHLHPPRIRFVALQVRRPSGTPQGILNMGVALHRNADQQTPAAKGIVEKTISNLALMQMRDKSGSEQCKNNNIHLWRSFSLGSEADGELLARAAGSVVNGSSMINGSELYSDIGPSASIVAAELALKRHQPAAVPRLAAEKHYEEGRGSSILGDLTVDEARLKGYRTRSNWRRQAWRKQQEYEWEEEQSEMASACSRHSRRNSDGGLFSCFLYGVEFTIVCGASNTHPGPGGGKRSSSNNGSRRNIIKADEASSY